LKSLSSPARALARVGEGDREAVEGAVTRTMLEVAPSVSRELMFARSTSPTLSRGGGED
jgi:hypothetical protein